MVLGIWFVVYLCDQPVLISVHKRRADTLVFSGEGDCKACGTAGVRAKFLNYMHRRVKT